MNKNKMCIIWLINIIMMLVMIIMPKNEIIYSVTYKMFLITTFVVPLVLSIISFQLWKKDNINTLNVQVIGNLLIIVVSFIRFVSNIESGAVPMYIFSLLSIVALLCLLIYFGYTIKSNKQYAYILIMSLLLTYTYFFVTMIISYDYSSAW